MPLKKTAMQLLRKTSVTSDLLSLFLLWRNNSYLRDAGWFNSAQKGLAIDKNGSPIPWFTYSTIRFLEGRIDRRMAVFEYGSGCSTLWFSSRANKVVSCEHDLDWFDAMKGKMPANVEYLHFELTKGGSYSQAVKQYKDNFDIIVIDGRDRVNCVRNSLEALKQDGIIIWDNSDRVDLYGEGFNFLAKNQFKRLDFNGMGPKGHKGWITSIYYRTENCFGI